MDKFKQYFAAEALEKHLGDPANPENIMSFKNSIDLDEQEKFPEEAVKLLHQWGTPLYYIPAEYGGKLKSYEEFFALIRVMARRDLSVAVSDMHTFLGALPVWIKGTDEQKQELAKFIQNHGYACLAVSEKAHGSDLLATETKAIKSANGYLLSGEKWPINKATLTDALTVLAKTDDRKSSRSLSVFLVYKKNLAPSSYSHLPKIKTLGIRSSDISGIRFNNCSLSESDLIGTIGEGLDLTLQGFFVTRTLCAFLSLGAADTALRTTLNLVVSRQLYEKPVFALPHARTVLANAFLDILICDCVSISAARGLHVVPKQFSVWSAIVKSFVTKRIEMVMNELSVILGARFYFREDHDWGIFQKVYRDNGIISVFDGSSIVNLYALILQLRQLAKSRQRPKTKYREALQSRLKIIFSLDESLPPFTGENLELFSRGCNDILQGLELSLEHLQTLTANKCVDATVLEKLVTLTHIFLEELSIQEKRLDSFPLEASHEQSFESFELAKQYCAIHAAVTCVNMWIYNRHHLGEFFAKGEWLVLCLERLMQIFRPSKQLMPQEYIENVTQEMYRLYTEEKMFSIVPFQIAPSGVAEHEPDEDPKIQLSV